MLYRISVSGGNYCSQLGSQEEGEWDTDHADDHELGLDKMATPIVITHESLLQHDADFVFIQGYTCEGLAGEGLGGGETLACENTTRGAVDLEMDTLTAAAERKE